MPEEQGSNYYSTALIIGNNTGSTREINKMFIEMKFSFVFSKNPVKSNY